MIYFLGHIVRQRLDQQKKLDPFCSASLRPTKFFSVSASSAIPSKANTKVDRPI